MLEPKPIFALPAGGMARFMQGEPPMGSVSFAMLWLRLSLQYAAIAEQTRLTEEQAEEIARALTDGGKVEAKDRGDVPEITAAVVAITAAAFALDAMHGALRPIVNPPATDGCKKPPRHAQVMELLKHGFQVSGRDQGHWPTELEWLFRLRNLSVHHGEELRPLVEEMRTDRVVVFAPAEAETFSPENARRAADFAKEVIEHCIQHPKPATAKWAGMRLSSLENQDD
jgi:hypothetical protein